MEKPKRIQRRRSKGWLMPENAVYVGRPSIWGNPFKTAAEFREWLTGCICSTVFTCQRQEIHDRVQELRGKDLACWCSLDQPCHADVLLELANGEGAK
ncbi:MAG: DUF4326 domain-containing protein [Hyphomicrobiaceae bacterium]|nr:MAG: DUF4326 domain-containing protein [Hyphomicrobiaceae bacterium]